MGRASSATSARAGAGAGRSQHGDGEASDREHQGEVFYTKTGKPFTYRTNRYTLVIVESRRNVQWHEIRSALGAWPIAGPSEIPRCPERSGRYVYGIVSDERIRQGDW